MKQTVFHVPKMDCPSEERLIRMAVDGKPGVGTLCFDLTTRQVTVNHEGEPTAILELLRPLNLGAAVASSTPFDHAPPSEPPPKDERGVLTALLAINALMFFVEIVAGIIAQSTGLIAESLDMFADAAVYGLSLYAVGRASSTQALAARLSGIAQGLLAVGVLSEVLRRFLYGSDPVAGYMMAISLLALVANVACMALIAKHREGGVHMKASWIFSTNDVIANLGVILAGALVAWTGSNMPDLVIGTLIGLVVLSGAVRIMRLAGAPSSG